MNKKKSKGRELFKCRDHYLSTWTLQLADTTEYNCPNVSLQCTNRSEEDVRCTAALSVTQFPRLCSGVRLASLLLVSCGFSVVATASVHRVSTKLLQQLLWSQIHPHILTVTHETIRAGTDFQSGQKQLREMSPGLTFRSGKSPPDFPQWSSEPLTNFGFGFGPSLNDLSRCFIRNAGVTVVLSCAPTLLSTDVSHSHFITFPLFPPLT